MILEILWVLCWIAVGCSITIGGLAYAHWKRMPVNAILRMESRDLKKERLHGRFQLNRYDIKDDRRTPKEIIGRQLMNEFGAGFVNWLIENNLFDIRESLDMEHRVINFDVEFEFFYDPKQATERLHEWKNYKR